MTYDDIERRATPPGKPVRILFHIDHFGLGGTETALLGWLNALDRRYFAPGLSVTFPTEELDFWREKSLPADVPVHVHVREPWLHTLMQHRQKRRLRTTEKLRLKLLTYTVARPLLARRFRGIASGYDVVCDFDFSLRYLAGSGGVPWFGVSHFSLAARLGNKSAAYVARRVRHYLRYNAIAMLTADMEREALQLVGTGAIDVVRLPNVVDIDAIRQRAAEPAEADGPDGPFIVSVARLDEGQKDHRTLLRAYAKVRAQYADAPGLLLLGDGADRASLEQLAHDLGVAAHVRFAGFCSNPFPFMRAARMLVLSSRYEGFGMVLLEAMALGTPVVSTDCPTGPRDLLDGGDSGLLVPPGDIDAMADAILKLLNDASLRERLVVNGMRKAKTLAPAAANQRMRKLVERLLRRGALAR